MRRRSSMVIAAMLAPALSLLAACNGGGDDVDTVQAWCGGVEAMADFLDHPPTTSNPNDLAELEAVVSQLEGVQHALIAGAPKSINEDVVLIFETDSDTHRISEQEDVDRARDVVDRYIRENCDLDIRL